MGIHDDNCIFEFAGMFKLMAARSIATTTVTLFQAAWVLVQARVLCNGLIESLGRVEFNGKVDHPFTAHPKIDAATGEAKSVPACAYAMLLSCVYCKRMRAVWLQGCPCAISGWSCCLLVARCCHRVPGRMLCNSAPVFYRNQSLPPQSVWIRCSSRQGL